MKICQKERTLNTVKAKEIEPHFHVFVIFTVNIKFIRFSVINLTRILLYYLYFCVCLCFTCQELTCNEWNQEQGCAGWKWRRPGLDRSRCYPPPTAGRPSHSPPQTHGAAVTRTATAWNHLQGDIWKTRREVETTLSYLHFVNTILNIL